MPSIEAPFTIRADGLPRTAKVRAVLPRRCVYFDVTGLVQWYAYKQHPSGIQRVMENVLGSTDLANHADVEFIARGPRSDSFYRVDRRYISGLTDPGMRRMAIASLRRLFADSLRAREPRRLWDKVLGDHLAYAAIGLSRVSRYWEALNLGSWPPKAKPISAAMRPSRDDTIVILGDFWCHKRQVEALVRLKSDTGAQIIAMIHDLFPIHHPDWAHPHFGKEFVNQFLALANHVDHWLTNSYYVKRQLTEFLKQHRFPLRAINVLPMGWPATRPRRRELPNDGQGLRRHGLTQDGYFLCVGTIEPRKNLASLIEATLRLNATANRLVCVFVGRAGWGSKELVKKLRMLESAHGCVRWISNADDEKLNSLYRNAKFTIVPSHDEGWGLVVQESLAHGVPCIAAAVGGMVEAGRNLATYVKPGDPSALLNAMRDYADDEEILLKARSRIQDRLKEGPLLPQWGHSVEFLGRLAGLNWSRLQASGEVKGRRMEASD